MLAGIERFTGRMKNYRQTLMRKDWRRKKFRDQDGRCFYCNVAMMLEGAQERQGNKCTLDHSEPLSRGGADHWENVVACCQTCNRRKRNMTAQEYMATLPNRQRTGIK